MGKCVHVLYLQDEELFSLHKLFLEVYSIHKKQCRFMRKISNNTKIRTHFKS